MCHRTPKGSKSSVLRTNLVLPLALTFKLEKLKNFPEYLTGIETKEKDYSYQISGRVEEDVKLAIF